MAKKTVNTRLFWSVGLGIIFLLVVTAALLNSQFISARVKTSSVSLTSLVPSSGPHGTKITAIGRFAVGGIYKINIGSFNNVASAKSSDGTTLSFSFPNTLCSQGKDCVQVLAKLGIYQISVTGLDNKRSNALNFNLTAPVTAQPTYFEFDSNNSGQFFTIKLTDPAIIQHARDLLSKKTTENPHVVGTLIKEQSAYNPKWNFYLEPSSIGFFNNSVEVCDASARYIQDHLAEACGAFLPNCVWCPWGSQLVREVSAVAR